MVTVNNISVYINNQQLLADVSCTLVPGRITMFIGKSGAGKTTLLKALVGLLPIQKGTIVINGKNLDQLHGKQRSEEIGYVFQDFNIFPHLTVLQNCVDPLLVHGHTQEEAQRYAKTVLHEVNMDSFINKYSAELSGGQLQRVAIARALCLKPKVLLLDEPTASLDPFNTESLITILHKLAGQGLIIGISSQDMDFVRKIFDRVYYIDDGNIVEFCDGKENVALCPIIEKFV